MAVTINPLNLQQPIGELDESLFPGCDFDNLLFGWLDQATSKVEISTGIETSEQNDAAAAWVYHRAYTMVADRFASTPSTITIDSTVTRTTSTDQRKYFAEKALKWLGVYQGFEAVAEETPVMAFFSTVKARRNVRSSFC